MTCVLSFAAGCATTTIDTYCERTFILEPSERDVEVISISLARQIVLHNYRRESVCEQ